MHIIFGNYGDNTIALIQWAKKKSLANVTVINVATGWGDASWQEHVATGKAFARKYFFKTVTLTPQKSFEELIKEQKSFPNQKYQWCPTFLKAVPLLNWLEQHDPSNQAIIMLGSRRADSRARFELPEFIDASEYYGERKVWYPLYATSNEDRDALIKEAGFEVRNTRSFECNPCIHKHYNDFNTLDLSTVFTIAELEAELNQTFFDRGIVGAIADAANLAPADTGLEGFDLGCGGRYACGE